MQNYIVIKDSFDDTQLVDFAILPVHVSHEVWITCVYVRVYCG